MSISRKFQRNLTKIQQLSDACARKHTQLWQIAKTMLAVGFMLTPMPAWAQSVVTPVGDNNISVNNGKLDIYAQKVVGDNAVNQFTNFQIGSGDTANMYFKTNAFASKEASNLFNFVQNRIDINGTINAIKNNTIGGNLYFFSSNGMAIGQNGVINAGSLHVLTPTQDKYNELLNGVYNGNSLVEANVNKLATEWTAIPVNSAGTITVLGKINALDSVNLRAGRVALGKNISGNDIDGVADSATVRTAQINTGAEAFLDIVNMGNLGIYGDTMLQAVRDGSGNVVLTAIATTPNTDANGLTVDGVDSLGNITNIDIQRKNLATVDVYGNINAGGNVELDAIALAGSSDPRFELANNTSGITLVNAFAGYGKTEAVVNIAGTVTGKQVAANAKALNMYANASNNVGVGTSDYSAVGSAIQEIVGSLGLELAGNVAVLESKAAVNVLEDASITATSEADNALRINADSTLVAATGASSSMFKLFSPGHLNLLPAASVTVVNTKNNAEVNIAGDVRATAGGLAIQAKGVNVVDTNATVKSMTTETASSNLIDTAVVVANSKNSSKVNIAHDISAQKEVSIKADSTNSLSTEASAYGQEDAAVVAAVNVTTAASSADVVIGGVSISGNGVKISAENTVTENKVASNSTIGMGSFMTQIVENSPTYAKVNELLTKLNNKIGGKLSGSNETFLDDLGKKFSIGANVTVLNETNRANVLVGHGAHINAGTADLKIDAQALIKDTNVVAVATTNNNAKNSTETMATGAATVLYADLDNKASVVIEGNDGYVSQKAILQGKNVEINAVSTFEYNRLKKMIEDVLQAVANIKATAQGEEVLEKVSALDAAANEIKGILDSGSINLENEELAKKLLALSAKAETLNKDESFWGYLKRGVPLVSQVADLGKSALAFAMPDNYLNFSAGSSVMSNKEGEEVPKFSLSGAVNINNLSNRAGVLVGQGAQITAMEAAKLHANITQHDTNMTGKVLPSSGSAIGLGANVGLYSGATDALVVVAKDAQIRAGSIDVSAINDVWHTGIVLNSGMASGNASVSIQGMVNVMGGDSNSIVSIDDEAKLTATKATVAEKDKTDGVVNLQATNKTFGATAAGGFTMGGAGGVGASVAVNNYDNNSIVSVADNGVDATRPTDDNLANLNNRVQGLAAKFVTNKDNILGTKTNGNQQGLLDASTLNAFANNNSQFVTAAVTGSFAMTGDAGEGSVGNSISYFAGSMSNKALQIINGAENKVFGALGLELPEGEGVVKPIGEKTNPPAQDPVKFNLNAAGSVSLNNIEGATAVVLDRANISTETLHAQAKDATDIDAWGGSLGFTMNESSGSSSNTGAGIAGVASVNLVDTDVLSLLQNSTINGKGAASSITNEAMREGSLVAAGLGIDLNIANFNEGSTNAGLAAAVDVNLAENTTKALMLNNNINTSADAAGKTSIVNRAQNNDLQVTGGINTNIITGGQSDTSIGVTIGVSELTNSVESKILGGTYEKMGSMDVDAVSALKQIGVAVGVGAAASTDKSYAFNGSAAANTISNTMDAEISNATITADSVHVDAFSGTFALKEEYRQKYAEEKHLDLTGGSFIKSNDETLKNAWGQAHGKDFIITGALSVAVGVGSGASGGAAVAISKITNDFNAKVTNANITITAQEASTTEKVPPAVQVTANSGSTIVGVAAGVGVSTDGYGVAGSVVVNNLHNDAKATVTGGTITTDALKLAAQNETLAIAAAGQVGVGLGGGAAGLGVIYNTLNNTTGTYLQGAHIQAINNAIGTDVQLLSNNTSSVYSVGVAAGVSTGTFALNGLAVLNDGVNNTEAIIGTKDGNRTIIDAANNVKVNASDATKLLAVAGNAAFSSQVAVGGAVAINQIGTTSNRQQTVAKVQNAALGIVNKATNLEVRALDTSNVKTITAGIGISGSSLSFQGVSSTSLLNKNVGASVESASIGAEAHKNANLTILAEQENEIFSNASVVSGELGTGAGIGAGVTVNRINQATDALLKDSTVHANDVLLKANAKPSIFSTAAGVGGAGTGAGVAGSVVVNLIANDVTALISGNTTSVHSAKNIGVVAQSDELINNYVGVASVAGTGAAVGLSVAVNSITGDTFAGVSGANLITSASAANTGIKTSDTVEDGNITGDDLVDEDIFNTDFMNRKENTYTGILVDASSTHDIRSFLINAGAAGEGANVAGNVDVNTFGGTTKASVVGATLNAATNVSVLAHDYTNAYGFVGNVGGSGVGASIGLGSDTNTMERLVEAAVVGSKNADGAVDKEAEITATAVKIDAEAKQGISSATVGVSVAGAGVGISSSTGVSLMKSTTQAMLENANLHNIKTLDVNAQHLAKIANLTSAVGLGGQGVAIGLGVSVLNDNSVVQTKLNTAHVEYVEDAGATNIGAKNTTKVNWHSYNIGGAYGGIAGSVGVANMNSAVGTDMLASVLGANNTQANAVNITSNNIMNFKQAAGTGAGGLAGVGVGVVVTTIDSQVNTNLVGGAINAKGKVTLSAEENRTLEQMAVNATAGVVAGGANVMVTTIGKELENVYKIDGSVQDDGKTRNDLKLGEIYGEAQAALTKNQLTSGGTGGVLGEGELPQGNASLGGLTAPAQRSAVTVTAQGTKINTASEIDAHALATTNAKLNSVNASLGLVSVSGAVGILNTHNNAVVELSGVNWYGAQGINVSSTQAGTSALDIYQGSAGGVTIGSAVALADLSGQNGIHITGASKLMSDNGGISVTATDNSAVSTNVVGVGAAVVATMGVLYTHATAANQVGIDIEAGNAFITKDTIDINALNNVHVSAKTGALNASLLASAALSFANASLGTKDRHAQAYVNVGESNAFYVGDKRSAATWADTDEKNDTGLINIGAKTDAVVKADMQGMSIGVSVGSVQVNTGGADVYADTLVDVAKNNVYANADNLGLADDAEKDYEANVNFHAENNVEVDVEAKGLSVAGVFASGTNIAHNKVVQKTELNLAGAENTVSNRIHDLTALAESAARVNVQAEGVGGAIVTASPYAAKIDNAYTADTNVNISKAWDVSGNVNAEATNTSDIDLQADAVNATLVGGSGVRINNNVTNNANVILTNANITSLGAQEYYALNNVDYNAILKAGGYGGGIVNAGALNDMLTFGAQVSATESNLITKGVGADLSLLALTQGKLKSLNELKSAGVIPDTSTESVYNITYDNGINLTNSALRTEKRDADVILTASDNTKVDLQAIANTQGGVAGAASSKVNNSITRNNKIKITGNKLALFSANDVNIYAGADKDGLASKLDLQVIADAYNKTVIPVATAPSIANSMFQNNQVTINSEINSVRNINLQADKGIINLVKSAREYRLFDGSQAGGGSGVLASTVMGDTIEDAIANNFVSLNAKAVAGVRDELEVKIDGNVTLNPVLDEAGKPTEGSEVSFENITVDVTKGRDWFNFGDVAENIAVVNQENPLAARYHALVNVMKQYAPDSEAYQEMHKQLNSLLLEMQSNGFAVQDENKHWEVFDERNIVGISMPDVVVSGGNINISTDKLQGYGAHLQANGNPKIAITNNSDLYLVINDLTIKDKGGYIRLNDKDLTSAESGLTSPTIIASTPSALPDISIHGTTASKPENVHNGLSAGLGINGSVVNSPGTVHIKNDNYDIEIQGNISAGDTVDIAAEHGSVKIMNTSNAPLLNIAGDPVTKYQISEDVVKKVLQYLNNNCDKGESKVQEFRDYEAFKNWLVTNKIVDPSDIPQSTDENESAGIHAGDNITIDALNVNINGLIQSGYGNYEVVLGEAAKHAVEKLDANWDDLTVLNNDDVLGNTKYLVQGGSSVWNATAKRWDYSVGVYYNPSTKQIITENVAPKGGKIDIKGHVSSSGDGRILAMDGLSDIKIDTAAVDKNLVVNTIKNAEIAGLITIHDKQKNTITEFKNGYERTYAANESPLDGWKPITNVYKPQEGIKYSWSGGISGTTYKNYQYTKNFLAWGGIKYGTTQELVTKIEHEGGQITADIVTRTDGDKLDSASFITVSDSPLTDYDFVISFEKITNQEEVYTGVVANKKYDGTAGKIFGYGKIYYSWSGQQGTALNTVSQIRADKDIAVGFINANASGDISITSAKDILLNGEISNASRIDANDKQQAVGKVTITSGGGIDVTEFGKIKADNLIVTAHGTTNLQHQAIADAASVNIFTTEGNIALVSTKGDLNINRLQTGTSGFNAESGSVSVVADGSIFDASTAAQAILAKRIDLVSKHGSVGTSEKAFRIFAAGEAYDTDSMSSSVNVKAHGDINLQQVAGNMRIGTIESMNGDVTLTVANGSFVDAYNAEVTQMDSADKIERWQELGIINEQDSDSESAKAAEQSKQERIDALESGALLLAGTGANQDAKVSAYKEAAAEYAQSLTNGGMKQALKTYQEAMKKASNEEDRNTAYANYQAAQAQFFAENYAEDVFNANEKAWIANYAELSNSNNYGWSKNELLYAIQDTILNSGSADAVQKTDYANVVGNNITLNAMHGGIGIDDAAVDIAMENLTDLENLKLLANSKAGELKWTDAGVTITRKQALVLGVNDANGVTNINTSGKIYLAGADATTFNIGKIETSQDVELLATNGVYMLPDDGTIKANNLILTGGIGSLGSAEKMLNIDLTGSLDARAGQDIYINGIGAQALVLQNVAAGNNLVINALNGMKMSEEAGKNMGYLTSEQGTITLTTANNTDIGMQNNGIRILGNDRIVTANAGAGDVYLAGQGTGTLNLAQVSGNAVEVTGTGNVSVESMTASADVNINVVGNVDIISLTASDAVNVTSGGALTVDMVVAKDVGFTAASVHQDKNAGGITANTLTITSSGVQELLSPNNNVKIFNINTDGEDTQDIHYVNNSADGAIFNLGNIDTQHALIIENLANSLATINSAVGLEAGFVHAVGDITITSAGSIENNVAFSSDSSISMNANGTITNNGNLTAKKDIYITSNEQFVTNNGSVTSTEENIIINAQTAINNNGDVNAHKKLYLIVANGVLNSNGSIQGGDGLVINSSEAIIIKGDVGVPKLEITSNNIELSSVINLNNTAPLEMHMNGNNGAAIKNLEIGMITSETGVVFPELYVENANIGVGAGELSFNKLKVKNATYVHKDDYTTAIFGQINAYDPSEVVYYDGHKDWMHLHFLKPVGTQLSDGLLVDLHGSKEVYSLRRSLAAESRMQNSKFALHTYDLNYTDHIGMFNRYNLYDLADEVVKIPDM